MSLKIRLLGPPELSHGDEPLEVPGYRPVALLAYLLITGKAHSRSHLSDLLFDAANDPRASLRWTLSKLRTSIGSKYLDADRDAVAFNFDSDYRLDVDALQAGDAGAYRGEFLEGLDLRDARRFEAWLLMTREQLRVRYQEVLEQRLVEQEATGDAAGIEETALKLLQVDNLREVWHRALIASYAEQGKLEAALAQYELCRDILREELCREPAPETAALAASVEQRQAELMILAAVAAPLSVPVAAGEKQPAEQRHVALQGPGGGLSSYLDTGSRRWTRQRVGIVAATGLLLVAVAVLLSFSNGPGSAGSAAPVSGLGAASFASGDLAGRTVTLIGPFDDDHVAALEQSLMAFEEESGINIEVGGYTTDFEDVLPNIIASGLSPDIVDFPQPGFLAEFVRQGKVVDVRSFLEEEYLRQQYGDALLDTTIIEGQIAAVWHGTYVKSLVWYPRDAFDAAGYEVPETWDELMALSEQIAADGHTPWCIGMESGEATGWMGTDWVEDVLLRTAPPTTYDAWVAGELPFASPEVRRVFAIMADIWLNEDYVHGGTTAILAEDPVTNALRIANRPPDCFLHKQASFALGFFNDEHQYGKAYDFFYLPPIDAEFSNPMLGGGDIMAMFNDRPEVRAVMVYLTTAESVRYMVEEGYFLAPHRDAPFEWYASPAQLKMAQILLSADTFRFDASDLMPSAVGTGSFWQGIVDWVEGEELDVVLQRIDESWPEGAGEE